MTDKKQTKPPSKPLEAALIPFGVVFVATAIVGGAVEALGFKLPAISSLTRQLVLAVVGTIMILVGTASRWAPLGSQAIAKTFRRSGVEPPTANVGVPPDPKPHFVGRVNDLEELHERLLGSSRTVLTGLAGVGKTQLAAHYVREYGATYPNGRLWIRGDDPATLANDYVGLGWLLHLPQHDWTQQQDVVDAVARWLRDNKGWLLVIDNLDRDAIPMLEQILPRGLGGHVLVTSRHPFWESNQELKPLSAQSAAAFLLERTGQSDLDAASDIAVQLGYLPLALEQATAYMRETGERLADYARLLRGHLQALLHEGRTADYPTRVATAWDLSFRRVEATSKAAADILRLCAFFAPDDTPLHLFEDGAEEVIEATLRDTVGDRLKLNRAVSVLLQYSLVSRQGDSLTVHRVVQAVLRNSLSPEDAKRWATTAVRMAARVFPRNGDEMSTWATCARLLPHARAAVNNAVEEDCDPRAVDVVSERIDRYLRARAHRPVEMQGPEQVATIRRATSTNERPRVLIVVTRARSASLLLNVAASVLSESGTGELLAVVTRRAEGATARTTALVRRYRAILRRMVERERDFPTRLWTEVRVAESLAQGVRDAAFESASDLIVLEWPGSGGGQQPVNCNLDEIVANPPADLVLVRPEFRGGVTRAGEGILVPVHGGPSADLAVRVASSMAAGRPGGITVMNVYDPRHTADRRRRSGDFRELRQRLGRRGVRVLEVESTNSHEAVTAEGQRYDVVVLDAWAEPTDSSDMLSTRLEETLRELSGTVILVKIARAATPILPEEEPWPPVGVPQIEISTVVDKWFAENTFYSFEFRDIRRLMQLKWRQGSTISLGLPTLNARATIGPSLSALRQELQDVTPLLDEIVVIDCGSTDGTPEIAQLLGVPVVDHKGILDELGSFDGRGEALWKSLHILSGDIVAWCRTDTGSITSETVCGIVGPLLSDPRVVYVKGFSRHIDESAIEFESGNMSSDLDRTALSLLNLFYPELSALLQPLSGQYAGRRHVLERLPFFTAEGVEIGHLIDLLENFGLNAIAQTDLGVRFTPKRRGADALETTFALLQVALKRMGDRHRMHLLEELNRTLRIVHYGTNQFMTELHEVADWERPPMAAIPEYLFSRGRIDTPDHERS